MIVDFDVIKEITLGAESIKEEADGIHFYRFTKEELALYKVRGLGYEKCLSTSGVRLRFVTNSERLYIKILNIDSALDTYFSLEIHINGSRYESIDNFNSVNTPEWPIVTEISGEFEKEVFLPEGENEICIYFPWSVCCVLKELVLEDSSYIKPIKPKNTILFFGDSITHGYRALFPSKKYTSLLANHLDAEEFNKAIGGDLFFPELVECKGNFIPEYIVVAYGTNDWNCCDARTFDSNCKMFYKNLANKYPDSKIFALSPIWRKDCEELREMGGFEMVAKYIENAIKDYENITFVNGLKLVNADERFYRDLIIHPNDEGFEQYFENLKTFIE